MKPALIIIDIQNDYFPGGKMELEGSPEASLQAAKLLASFRAKELPLVHIQHVSNRPGASFFLPDTEGVNIHAKNILYCPLSAFELSNLCSQNSYTTDRSRMGITVRCCRHQSACNQRRCRLNILKCCPVLYNF